MSSENGFEPEPQPAVVSSRWAQSLEADAQSLEAESSGPQSPEAQSPEPQTGGDDQLLRLHPSSIFFELISHGRQFLMPAIFAFLGAAQGSWFWGVLALVSFGFSLLGTIFKYFTLRYGIRDGELIVRHGLIFRQERTVPTRRIQNMDLTQNVLHRVFGVAEVKIETASGQEAEAVLRVLTKTQIESLRKQIFSARRSGQAVVATVSGAGDGPEIRANGTDALLEEEETVLILKIPVTWLAAAGLSSNRGWLLVGIVIGLLFQFDFFENSNPRAVGRFFSQLIPNLRFELAEIPRLLLYAAGFLAVLKMLGIAWFLMRFYGYRLERAGEDLRVTGGMFTSHSATVPRKRIQFISIYRPLTMRWMGLATIRIETAGGAGAGDEESQATVARRWFIPVVPVAQVPRLIAELRPGLVWDESAVQWKGTANGTHARLLRMGIVLSVLATAIGLAITRPWGGLAGVVVLAFSVCLANRTSRSMKYSRTSFGVAYRSGILVRRLSFTFFERLQSVQFQQSPFDRRWKMATLSVDTAAAGPAGHVISVPYLEENFARDEFRLLKRAAANHRPTWT